MSWWVPAVIGVVAVCLAALIFLRLRERRIVLVLGGASSLLLCLLAIGAGVNVHFDYFRTIGEVVGVVPGGASAAEVRKRGARAFPPRAWWSLRRSKEGVRVRRAGRADLPAHAAYFAKPRHLPVLMLFHGDPGQPTDWVEGGTIDVTANAYAKANDGQAPIIVMPDISRSITGDTEYVDGTRGNAESYLTNDVRDAVVATYSTASDAKRWAIGGLSEGVATAPSCWAYVIQTCGRPSSTCPAGVPSPGGTTAKKLLRGWQRGCGRCPLSAGGAATAECRVADARRLVRRGGTGRRGRSRRRPGGRSGGTGRGSPDRVEAGSGICNFFFWSSAMAKAFPWIAQRWACRDRVGRALPRWVGAQHHRAGEAPAATRHGVLRPHVPRRPRDRAGDPRRTRPIPERVDGRAAHPPRCARNSASVRRRACCPYPASKPCGRTSLPLC